MTDREQTILNAALRLFSRYGVKRSSMSDIAEEAGIARQTLYNAYRNKDDVLSALIGYYNDVAIEEIRAGLDVLDDLGDRLDIVFAGMSLAGYDITAATPNARDIIDGYNAAGRAALEVATGAYRALIAEILAPYSQNLARAGIAPDDLADFVARAARSASTSARDRAHLSAQLTTLRQLCLAAAGISQGSLPEPASDMRG